MKQTIVAANLNQDYGDTVPSKPQNIGLQVASEIAGSELVAEGMYFIMLNKSEWDCYYFSNSWNLKIWVVETAVLSFYELKG